MTISKSQIDFIEYIDRKMSMFAELGYDDESILVEMVDDMPLVKELVYKLDAQVLNDCCNQYYGFYCFMKLLETIAARIEDSTIKVPA